MRLAARIAYALAALPAIVALVLAAGALALWRRIELVAIYDGNAEARDKDDWRAGR